MAFNLNKKYIAAALSLMIFHSQAFGLGSGGLSNITATTSKSAGHGYAFAGAADDPSAVWFNPAGITQLKGLNLAYGATALVLNTEHTTPSGQTDKLSKNYPIAPYVYMTYSRDDSPWAYGLGVNAPYGLITEWKNDSFAKYYATKSFLYLTNINPTVAYEVSETFSVGAGLDYVKITDVELNRRVTGAGVVPDGHAKLSGDGDGWGYNAGMHWKPNSTHNFGLAYRSQVNVPVDGMAELRDIYLPAFQSLIGGGSSYSTGMDTEFKFGQNITLGYAYTMSEKWRLFADYEWANWSVVDNNHINYDQGVPTLLPTDIPRNWRSTNNVGLGAEFKATESLDVRFGTLVYESAIPEGTFEAAVPAPSRYMLAGGLGYHGTSLTLDFATGVVFYNKKNVNNNQEVAGVYSQDGEFKSYAPFVTVGLSHKWGGN